MLLETNPLVPSAYDWVWSVLAAAVLVVTLAAAISVARHSRVLSGMALAAWLVFTLFLPPIGGIVWFVAGRPRAHEDMDHMDAGAPPQR